MGYVLEHKRRKRRTEAGGWMVVHAEQDLALERPVRAPCLAGGHHLLGTAAAILRNTQQHHVSGNKLRKSLYQVDHYKQFVIRQWLSRLCAPRQSAVAGSRARPQTRPPTTPRGTAARGSRTAAQRGRSPAGRCRRRAAGGWGCLPDPR